MTSSEKTASSKLRGAWHRSTGAVAKILIHFFFAFIGAFAAIACLGGMSATLWGSELGVALIGSFGATAVLLYAAPLAPLSQPRNVLGGHATSALVGVTVASMLSSPQWLAGAFAVALAITAMQVTRTLHPPGGATALIAVIGPESIKSLGYGYVVAPVLCGAGFMVLVAYGLSLFGGSYVYPAARRSADV